MKFTKRAAAAAIMLSFAIALPSVSLGAFRSAAPGTYEVRGKATGGIPVSGNGKFSVSEGDGKVVFRAPLRKGVLDMGIRDKHTRKEFELGDRSEAKLVVKRSALQLPKEGAQVSGTVRGTLTFQGVTRPVDVQYAVRRTKGAYTVSSASFTFDYTKFRPKEDGDDKEICKAIVCVKPSVTIALDGAPLRLEDA